jgi:hypothetical protein
MRESLLLLLLAFWQEDTSFLAHAMLGLATGPPPPDFDQDAFASDLAASWPHTGTCPAKSCGSVRHRLRLPPYWP